jgi:hypothetical protein
MIFSYSYLKTVRFLCLYKGIFYIKQKCTVTKRTEGAKYLTQHGPVNTKNIHVHSLNVKMYHSFISNSVGSC